MVAGLLCGLMMVVGWLDDGGCVGCLESVREMTVRKNEYFIEGMCRIDKLMWVFCKNGCVK